MLADGILTIPRTEDIRSLNVRSITEEDVRRADGQ